MKKMYFVSATFLTAIALLMVFQGSTLPKSSPNASQNSQDFNYFSFEVNNTDPEKIGYEVIENGEDIGIKSIAISGEWAIISDPFHSNLKKIHLSTGELISGPNIDHSPTPKRNIWLGDLAIFQGNIYVCAMDSIFSFNQDLQKVSSWKVERGTKKIWKCEEDQLQILLGYRQLENLDIELSLLSFTEDGVMTEITQKIPQSEYRKKALQTTASGIAYSTKQLGNGYEFHSEEGHVFPLSSDIPKVLTYDANNVAFSTNRLVYFTSDSKTFHLFSHTF